MFGTLKKIIPQTGKYEIILFGFGSSITGTKNDILTKEDVELFETEKKYHLYQLLKKCFTIRL